jgi:hypothetical protein
VKHRGDLREPISISDAGLSATSFCDPGGIMTGLQVSVSEEEKKAFNAIHSTRRMNGKEREGKCSWNCVVQGSFKPIDEGPSALFDDGYVTRFYDPEKEGKFEAKYGR